MRVIAGQYRGRKLKSPPSLETRPTSDRLRETLFNVIAPRIKGARFLDLCAGSGAVGIEALSRGAGHMTFVDRSRRMCTLIATNLNLCHVGEDLAAVVTSDALEFLQKAVKRQPGIWDIMFFDPPYSENYLPVLKALGGLGSGLLSPEGLLVIEHHYKTELPEKIGALTRRRVLKQGDSALSFYDHSDTITALDHLAVS